MADAVRQAREELMRVGLLGRPPESAAVPDLILRSWRRSIGVQVDSAAPCQRYDEVDTDSILCRAADPVLDRWQSQLIDTGATLFLSDRGGSIVSRRASDNSLRRRLDAMHAAEGFDYSEDSIGTNGLGTSMVERTPVFIEGAQHYNDALEALACAAVPLFTPGGVVIGSVSLGGPRETASPLMMSLTREIGHQIEERLRAASRPEDLALAMSFMRYANSKRPTIVVDQESLLSNTPGLPYVSVSSHVMLWEILQAHDWRTGQTAELDLPQTGLSVTARRATDGPRVHYIVHFSGSLVLPAQQSDYDPTSASPVLTSSIPASTTRIEVEPSTSPVTLVVGPRGSGRATKARDLRARTISMRALTTIIVSPAERTDWTSITEALATDSDVLIRRLEEVPARDAARLMNLVTDHAREVEAGRRATRLLLTASRHEAAPVVRGLIDKLGADARTHPLSETPDRIPELVRSVFDTVDTTGSHTLSPAALQILTRWEWPGNLAELTSVVTALITNASSSVIESQHLPVYLRNSAPRKKFSLIEEAERDAIIRALDTAEGNKSEAAQLLGIGRTTLYRRLRHFGLDVNESSL